MDVLLTDSIVVKVLLAVLILTGPVVESNRRDNLAV